VSITFSPSSFKVPEEEIFNLSNMNALAFLSFLGFVATYEGQETIPTIRQKIMVTRATMDTRVRKFTRPSTDTQRPWQCRVIDQGIDNEYFERRLNHFAKLVEAWAKLGATHISWG
jgi:hypothetical protein